MDMAWKMGNDILASADGPTSVFLAWSSEMMVIVLAVMTGIGIITCFLGLKLVRILSAFAGLITGAAVGLAAVFGFGISGTAIPVVILAGAVVLAVLCTVIRKLGAFVLVLLSTAGIVSSILLPQTWILAGVCLAAALIMAILSVIKTEAVVVVITGISGGLAAGMSIAALTGLDKEIWWIGYAIGVVLAFVGIWIQFMMHSRKIGKKEKVYSKQVREEESRESEVERARQILEDEEEDEDGRKEEEDDREDDITIISEEL